MAPSPDRGQPRVEFGGRASDRGGDDGKESRRHKEHKHRDHKEHKHERDGKSKKSRKHKEPEMEEGREEGEIEPMRAASPSAPASTGGESDHVSNGLHDTHGRGGSDNGGHRSKEDPASKDETAAAGGDASREAGDAGERRGTGVHGIVPSAAAPAPVPRPERSRSRGGRAGDEGERPTSRPREHERGHNPDRDRHADGDGARMRSRDRDDGDARRDGSRRHGGDSRARDAHHDRDRERGRGTGREGDRDRDGRRSDRSRGERGPSRDGRNARSGGHARDAERGPSRDGRDARNGGHARDAERTHKRSRSARDREHDHKRSGRAEGAQRRSDERPSTRGGSSPEGDDPLLGVDPDEEEQRQIEARRARLAAIKAKQQQAEEVAAPTAAALVAEFVRDASEGLGEASAAPRGDGGAGGGVGDGLAGGAGCDGDATPEGDRESDSDSEGGGKGGPVLEIFAGGGDEAESGGGALGASGVGGGDAGEEEPSAAPEGTSTGLERLRVRAMEAVVAAKAKVKGAPGGATPPAAKAAADDDDEDDMFAEEVAVDRLVAGGGGGGGQVAAAAALALADAYDDAEGYYNFVVGEVMDGRYEVFAHYGKGVFGSVVRARDMSRRDEAGQHLEVAIKLIRSNETMYKAAQTEVQMLRLLGAADPDNHKHCIRLLRTFEYRNHMCMVFEAMEMNLRDLTKKYGRNRGLDVKAVQLFTCQLLIALRHLKKNNVLHADIKPDNLLINHRHNKVKICDFGSAMLSTGENDITPYLVSRFYRAPEVILGLKYEFGMDMWSIGCVVYELYTGRILFPGHSNNEMLKHMMEVKGAFPKKMLRRAEFTHKHFESDQNMSFASVEVDPITKTQVRRLIAAPAVKNSFATLLQRHSKGTDGRDKALTGHLVDLLERMMALEPEKRIDPDTALKHPFVRDVLPKRKEAKAAKA